MACSLIIINKSQMRSVDCDKEEIKDDNKTRAYLKGLAMNLDPIFRLERTA